MNRLVRPRTGRARSTAALVLAAVAGALVLVLTGCGRSSRITVALAPRSPTPEPELALVPSRAGSTYTLMQMNLCLSGLAGCYGKVAYPAVVEEATARIQETHPDAVTFNEACRNDVALIARRTGYHPRFSTVIYGGKPFPCINPSGRGLFGDAVLTKAAIESSNSQAFEAQAGIEQRRWLCVSTRAGVEVCTAHLASHEPDEAAANDPQCAELGALLARRGAARTVIFGGDVNRRGSCAPSGFWTRTDSSADQDPGLQQVYATAALHSPTPLVVPAAHSDHDILLVRAQVARAR